MTEGQLKPLKGLKKCLENLTFKKNIRPPPSIQILGHSHSQDLGDLASVMANATTCLVEGYF